MRTLAVFFIFLLFLPQAQAQILVETPAGERRLRYEVCDDLNRCRMVEQTLSYPICDEHHNCVIVDAYASGTAKIWEEEELMKSGSFTFMPYAG